MTFTPPTTLSPKQRERVESLDDEARMRFEERAATLEYDGNRTRAHAEAVAYLEIVSERLRGGGERVKKRSHPPLRISERLGTMFRIIRMPEPKFKGWCIYQPESNSWLPLSLLSSEPEKRDPSGRLRLLVSAIQEVEWRIDAEDWNERAKQDVNLYANATASIKNALAWRAWGSTK